MKLISEARLLVTQNEGRAADALTSPIAKQLALLSKQAEVLSKVKTPVYIPHEGLGALDVWSKNPEDGVMAHFTNTKGSGTGNGGDSTGIIAQMLAADAISKK